MSRVGLKPIELPQGVEVKVDGDVISVKGPKGELTETISSLITVKIDDGVMTFERSGETKEERSQHGLARTLVNNMVVGVTNGYEKKLEIQGVGYRAEKKGNVLVLTLGFSHPVELEDPEGIETEVPAQDQIIVKGISKAHVGNYAANIRALRAPEPYKGKGIRYADEHVRRKEGKTGVAAGAGD
jgi:large subunit ribosomal protein L6